MKIVAWLLLSGALCAQTPRAIETLQTQVDELRDRLRQTKVERDILDDRLHAQHEEIASLKKEIAKLEPNDELKAKLAAQAKRQEALVEDIKHLKKNIDDSAAGQEQLKKAIEALAELLQKPCSSSKSYTVKPGDSLEKIARNTGVSVSQLRQKNNLSGDRINIGQELFLE